MNSCGTRLRSPRTTSSVLSFPPTLGQINRQAQGAVSSAVNDARSDVTVDRATGLDRMGMHAPVDGAGIAESDGNGDSACGCGGEEGEAARKAAVGIGG